MGGEYGSEEEIKQQPKYERLTESQKNKYKSEETKYVKV